MRSVIVLLALVLLCSCSYPTSVMRPTSKDTLLTFADVPHGAVLYIDDREVGPAAQYEGRRSLALPPGRHKITVVQNGAVIYTDQAYLPESAVKKITLGAR